MNDIGMQHNFVNIFLSENDRNIQICSKILNPIII